VRIIGAALVWIGIVWIAYLGVSTWSVSSPSYFGLSLGQMLIATAAVMVVGMIIPVLALRRTVD
jgi:hypothetical protein